MKNKYLFGGVIVVVFLSLTIYLLTKTNIAYENNFAKIKQTEKTVKATGQWVKEKIIHLIERITNSSFL